MATIRGLGRRGVGTLLLAMAIFTVLGIRHAARSQADEEPTQRLLVKCRPADAPAVLAALKGLPVEVWNLDTMKRIPTGVARKPTPQPTKGSRTLALPDAALVMKAVQGALASLTPSAGHMVAVTVQPRRAVLTLWVPDHDALDRIRRALAKEPHLKARGARPNVGAQQPTPSGLQVKVTLAFSPGQPGRAAPPAFRGDLALLVAKAARQNRASLTRRGALRQDPNRGAGHMTSSMEFRFAKLAYGQFEALLGSIVALAPGLTVMELHWTLVNPGTPGAAAPLGNPVIRVGWRKKP